jgi:hypothetical protein
MTTIPTIPDIQIEGYRAMTAGQAMRGPDAPGGFTFNPYPPDTVERINFAVGCIVAAFPKLQ